MREKLRKYLEDATGSYICDDTIDRVIAFIRREDAYKPQQDIMEEFSDLMDSE